MRVRDAPRHLPMGITGGKDAVMMPGGESRMRILSALGIAMMALVVLFNSGCQCHPRIDVYEDAIDDISDNSLKFDGLYRPGLDLTRCGKPDWCSSPINRLFYKGCCANCQEAACPSCGEVH
jgi:hypothetical protein